MAVWIREREQIQILDADPENGTGSILITCRNVTYQILVEQTESGIRRMTVDLKFIKRLEAIKQISYILEADRIRWYIMEHTDPAFAKGPQIFYGTVQNMFRFRYIVFGIVGWVLSYATIMIALQLPVLLTDDEVMPWLQNTGITSAKLTALRPAWEGAAV